MEEKESRFGEEVPCAQSCKGGTRQVSLELGNRSLCLIISTSSTLICMKNLCA